LHAGGVTGKGGSKLRGIDGKRAVIVEVNAETGEAGDAVVAGDRGGERGEKAGLRFACGAVGFERTATGAVEIYSKLRIDVLDDGVVGGDELIDGVGGFGDVGGDGQGDWGSRELGR